MLLDDRELQGRVARLEALLMEIESLPDPRTRAKATEAVQVLLHLYSEGLARMMEVIARGEERERTFAAFAEDGLVAHLLLLHGLHPESVETRVARALDEVRPYLQSHGGNVVLVGIEDGVARLRLQGSCHGCPSSAMTLKLAIEEALQQAAPDLAGIDAEGVAEPPSRPAAFIPVAALRKKGQAAEEHSSSWTVAGGLPQLAGGGLLVKEVAGESVLFLRLEGDFYAYRHRCPGCGESLDRGSLRGAELTCPGCGQRYDVRRAGRGLDSPQLYLEPLPLLVSEQGLVKVALPSAVG